MSGYSDYVTVNGNGQSRVKGDWRYRKPSELIRQDSPLAFQADVCAQLDRLHKDLRAADMTVCTKEIRDEVLAMVNDHLKQQDTDQCYDTTETIAFALDLLAKKKRKKAMKELQSLVSRLDRQ
jgi:hypothetical protein